MPFLRQQNEVFFIPWVNRCPNRKELEEEGIGQERERERERDHRKQMGRERRRHTHFLGSFLQWTSKCTASIPFLSILRARNSLSLGMMFGILSRCAVMPLVQGWESACFAVIRLVGKIVNILVIKSFAEVETLSHHGEGNE
jgi:hypothetical protein